MEGLMTALVIVGIIQVITLITFFVMASNVSKLREYVLRIGIHQGALRPDATHWFCPQCGTRNYAMAQKCNKCRTPKPESV